MPDREKVTYDIERCICRVPDACRDCSHYQDDRLDCMEKLLADALSMLKEQEAVSIEWKYGFPHCPVCGQMLPEGDAVKYCLHCGQAVKWDA